MAEFIDAQAMARERPKTFDTPTQQTIKNLLPGDFVKVCAAGERFWVKLQTIDGSTLRGSVSNDLVLCHGLNHGDNVTLEARHIYAVMKGAKFN